MNQEPQEPAVSRREIDSLARATKIAFLSFTLIFSYFAIRLAFSTHLFSSIFEDLLGGKDLPALTTFVIRYEFLWVLLSFVLPVAAIGAVFVKPASRSILMIAISGGLLLVQSFLLWTALFQPFFQMIQDMQR